MNDIVINYLLFIGMGLYLASTLVFLYLWLRTNKTKDGIGLVFLQFLTFGLFIGSLVIGVIRIGTYFFGLNSDIGRAIAVINPVILICVGFYLNYLFKHPGEKGKLK